MKKYMISIIILCVSFLLHSGTMADNPVVSNWMVNISEDNGAPAIGLPEYAAEIEVSGASVHVLWLRDDYDNNRRYLCYRHSLDNGVTWEPVHIVYENEWDNFLAVTTSKRMSVSGNNVNIVMASKDELYYIRSVNGGASFEDPEVLLPAQPGQVIYDVMIDSKGPDITILYKGSGPLGASINTFCSRDSGSTFLYSLITEDLDWRWWYLCDAYCDGSRMYVLWLYNYNQYGSTIQGDLRLGVSDDGGQYFEWKLISVPSLNGLHRTESLQYDNYLPKIAVDGPDVYVTWTGRDYDDLMSVFIRRSPDYGETFDEAINVSRDKLSQGQSVYASLESVYAKGGNVYSLFQTTDSRIYMRAGAGNFGPIISINATPGTPIISSGWWPQAAIDPSDVTGKTLHAVFNYPVYFKTTDGGQSIFGPASVGPHYNWQTGTKRPRLTVGEDGIVHMVVEGCVKIFKDIDIFYRRIIPAPESGESMALKIFADPYPADRNGMMVIPNATQLQFADQLTMECWVNPDPGTYKQTRIITKENTETSLFYSPTAYQLGTQEYAGQRATHGGIKTGDGVFMAWGGYITEGTWTHMALTYDKNGGTDNLILYLNGEVSATTTATGNILTGDGLLIVGATRADDNYNGYIDEVRLWNKTLTQNEIQQMMYSSLNGNESGLVAYYSMDGTTRDLTDFNNDGYLCYTEDFYPQFIEVPDSDTDGVDDLAERGFDGLDVSFDGNGDGLPDWKQSTAASLKNYRGDKYMTLATLSPPELKGTTDIIPLSHVTATDVPANQPFGYIFPYEMIEFSFDLPDGTSSAEVKLYTHGTASYDTWVNYGPLSSEPGPIFYGFKYDDNTGATIVEGMVTLKYSDGQRGDHDLQANGSVITLGGPGKAPEGWSEPGPTFNNLIFYPNPATGVVTLEKNSKDAFSVEMVTPEGSFLGSYLFEGGIVRVRLHDVAPGVYIVLTKDQTGAILQSGKLLIMR